MTVPMAIGPHRHGPRTAPSSEVFALSLRLACRWQRANVPQNVCRLIKSGHALHRPKASVRQRRVYAPAMHHLSLWSLSLTNAHNTGVMALFTTAPQQMQMNTAATDECRHCSDEVHWCVVSKLFQIFVKARNSLFFLITRRVTAVRIYV